MERIWIDPRDSTRWTIRLLAPREGHPRVVFRSILGVHYVTVTRPRGLGELTGPDLMTLLDEARRSADLVDP